MIFIYSTCASEEEASKIATVLLEKKLIVCANWWPSRSCYEYQGKKCNAKEIVMILKTDDSKYNEVQKQIRVLHSYETPIIAKIKVDEVNKDYEDWLLSSLTA